MKTAALHAMINMIVFGIASYHFGLWVVIPLLVVYANGLVQAIQQARNLL